MLFVNTINENMSLYRNLSTDAGSYEFGLVYYGTMSK